MGINPDLAVVEHCMYLILNGLREFPLPVTRVLTALAICSPTVALSRNFGPWIMPILDYPLHSLKYVKYLYIISIHAVLACKTVLFVV